MPLYPEAGYEFMRRVSGALTWETVSVPVDSVPTPFTVAQVGEGWVALGEGPLSTITIAAHHVALDEISLVRLSDLPPLNPRLPRRPPRARRFPDRDLTPAVVLGVEANMDLQYDQGRLVGTYNGHPVDIEGHGPSHHRAQVSGTFAGFPMSANWTLGGSSNQHHSTLEGRLADSTLTLTGEFHIHESIVQSASLSGRFAGLPIEAAVEAVDGGLSDYRTVAIDGDFAGTSFALFATIGHMTGNIVTGTIDNIPVRIDAKAQAPEGPTNVTGAYHGPTGLLAVMVGTLLFFS